MMESEKRNIESVIIDVEEKDEDVLLLSDTDDRMNVIINRIEWPPINVPKDDGPIGKANTDGQSNENPKRTKKTEKSIWSGKGQTTQSKTGID